MIESVNLEPKPKAGELPRPAPASGSPENSNGADTKTPDSGVEAEAAKVVSLDHFRKK